MATGRSIVGPQVEAGTYHTPPRGPTRLSVRRNLKHFVQICSMRCTEELVWRLFSMHEAVQAVYFRRLASTRHQISL